MLSIIYYYYYYIVLINIFSHVCSLRYGVKPGEHVVAGFVHNDFGGHYLLLLLFDFL